MIRDNFWVVFQDPEQDLFVTDANFRAQSEPLLALPGQIDELKNLLGLWSAYRDKRNEYETCARTSTPTRHRRPGTRSGTATTTPC